MRRATLSLTLTAAFLGVASSAIAGGLDLRVGGFFPRGQDILFQDLNALYTPNADPRRGVKGSDFNGATGGIEFNATIAPNLEFGVHLDFFGRDRRTSYRDYTRPDGSEVRQKLSLRIAPIGATLRVLPTSKSARFVPYLGAGVDAFVYSYEESGDFIDFYDANLRILQDDFKATGAAFGGHLVGGVRVYLSRDFAVVGEGRYQLAKHTMKGDFAPNEPGLVNRIDLSGASFVAAFHVRF